MSMVPAYAKIYNIIKQEIQNGDYSSGDAIPPEPELCNRFNVSRTTVRRAMDLLARDGYVSIKQGLGTTVLDYTIKQNLNGVSSISESFITRGYKMEAENIKIDLVNANEKLAQEFKIAKNSPVYRIQRLQLADQKPVAIMKNYLIPSMVVGIENYKNKFSSFYRFLEEYYNIKIDAAYDRISAGSASIREAELLKVPLHTSLLNIRRICYSNSIPVVVDQVYVIGEIYELEIYHTGRIE